MAELANKVQKLSLLSTGNPRKLEDLSRINWHLKDRKIAACNTKDGTKIKIQISPLKYCENTHFYHHAVFLLL